MRQSGHERTTVERNGTKLRKHAKKAAFTPRPAFSRGSYQAGANSRPRGADMSPSATSTRAGASHDSVTDAAHPGSPVEGAIIEKADEERDPARRDPAGEDMRPRCAADRSAAEHAQRCPARTRYRSRANGTPRRRSRDHRRNTGCSEPMKGTMPRRWRDEHDPIARSTGARPGEGAPSSTDPSSAPGDSVSREDELKYGQRPLSGGELIAVILRGAGR